MPKRSIKKKRYNLETSRKCTQKHGFEWRVLDFTFKNALANFKLNITKYKLLVYGPF